MDLKTIDWDKIDNSINLFTFYGETKLAKCVDVYDGDTIKVVFPLENKLYKWNCRLSGIDTPELRTKNKKEKELGYIVRDKLREKIFNKIIHVKCDKFDKYGRLLIEIFGYLRMLVFVNVEPLGIPVIKTAEELANEEIKVIRD